MSTKKDFLSVEELKSWLIKNQIPIQEWGLGHAKTILQLYHEINKGECKLLNDPPKRILPVVQVIIQRDHLVLVELEQELSDLRKRKRCLPPSEKMKPDETWLSAAIRCLDEELSLQPNQFTILSKNCEPIIHERLSQSYPGLPSQYHVYSVHVRANDLPEIEFWTDEKADPGNKTAVRRHLWGWIAYNKIIPL
ncbi:MAG: hypothetical protein CL609_04805 [Anaerolineaceae bacterium]|nr:hypothetical protein [Anaerolineaceae bacterium]